MRPWLKQTINKLQLVWVAYQKLSPYYIDGSFSSWSSGHRSVVAVGSWRQTVNMSEWPRLVRYSEELVYRYWGLQSGDECHGWPSSFPWWREKKWDLKKLKWVSRINSLEATMSGCKAWLSGHSLVCIEWTADQRSSVLVLAICLCLLRGWIFGWVLCGSLVTRLYVCIPSMPCPGFIFIRAWLRESLSILTVLTLSYHIPRANKKTETQNLKYSFYWIFITFTLLQISKIKS